TLFLRFYDWCQAHNGKNNPLKESILQLISDCSSSHDKCGHTLKRGETKYGLYNAGLLTRSHCDCDKQLYKCLKNSSSPMANLIGITYFNALRLQCFKKDYPAVCTRHKYFLILQDKCLEYNYSKNEPQTVQWFDQPDF
ncbi:phospholipase A2-like, partial [Copidosoma floridanum]|uniref:phospholipase A2-like n=1 Tax=Copidosoma floridanum TaxID=29053 RepID=UPI0006C98DE1